MRILLPSLLMFAAACTPTARCPACASACCCSSRAALEKALAGYVPGKPQSCVDQTRLRESDRYGDTIVYHAIGGAERIVNHTSGDCAGGGIDSFLVTRTPTGQLCRGDIAEVVDRASRMTVGSCSYGDFIPYSRAR